MNTNVFTANIKWLKPCNQGRNLPIPMFADRYAPIVSVDGQKETCGGEWSLLCKPFKLIGEYNTMAYVRYLNTQDAPNNLHIGSRIEYLKALN